jgi:hypothetical protein
MKKIYLIMLLVLLSSPAYATGEVVDTIISAVFMVSIAISLILSGVAFVFALFIAVPVFVVSATYYTGKSFIVKEAPIPIYETQLCEAAKDLSLDFTSGQIPNAYYANKPFNDLDFEQIKELEPFFKPLDKVNRKPNYLCIDSDGECRNKLELDFKENYKQAAGQWKPIRAFSYNKKSFIQLQSETLDGKYETATADFNLVFNYFNYDGFYVFRMVDQNFDVKDLCPLLRRVSIHKLKGLKEVI